MAASVRHRLQDTARALGRPFQEVLEYYAMERLLYRLARSPQAGRFVLKGALMFRAWGAPAARPSAPFAGHKTHPNRNASQSASSTVRGSTKSAVFATAACGS
jgi:hypothetical protein